MNNVIDLGFSVAVIRNDGLHIVSPAYAADAVAEPASSIYLSTTAALKLKDFLVEHFDANPEEGHE